jgi:hypothetical protein
MWALPWLSCLRLQRVPWSAELGMEGTAGGMIFIIKKTYMLGKKKTHLRRWI